MANASGYAGDTQSQGTAKPRELEALCERLGRTMAQMRENNDSLQMAVSHLCNEPQAAGAPGLSPATLAQAESALGTLGSLSALADKIANEVDRQGNLRTKLGNIF